jgi:hypothetical protein
VRGSALAALVVSAWLGRRGRHGVVGDADDVAVWLRTRTTSHGPVRSGWRPAHLGAAGCPEDLSPSNTTRVPYRVRSSRARRTRSKGPPALRHPDLRSRTARSASREPDRTGPEGATWRHGYSRPDIRRDRSGAAPRARRAGYPRRSRCRRPHDIRVERMGFVGVRSTRAIERVRTTAPPALQPDEYRRRPLIQAGEVTLHANNPARGGNHAHDLRRVFGGMHTRSRASGHKRGADDVRPAAERPTAWNTGRAEADARAQAHSRWSAAICPKRQIHKIEARAPSTCVGGHRPVEGPRASAAPPPDPCRLAPRGSPEARHTTPRHVTPHVARAQSSPLLAWVVRPKPVTPRHATPYVARARSSPRRWFATRRGANRPRRPRAGRCGAAGRRGRPGGRAGRAAWRGPAACPRVGPRAAERRPAPPRAGRARPGR